MISAHDASQYRRKYEREGDPAAARELVANMKREELHSLLDKFAEHWGVEANVPREQIPAFKLREMIRGGQARPEIEQFICRTLDRWIDSSRADKADMHNTCPLIPPLPPSMIKGYAASVIRDHHQRLAQAREQVYEADGALSRFVRKHYKRNVLKVHPDKLGRPLTADEQKTYDLLQEAEHVLTDPSQRLTWLQSADDIEWEAAREQAKTPSKERQDDHAEPESPGSARDDLRNFENEMRKTKADC